MPRETVIAPERRTLRQVNAAGTPLPADLPPLAEETRLGVSVGWNKIGWVQLHMFEEGWDSTAEWHIVDLDRADINRLIGVLKKARDKAFGKDA